VYVIVAATRVPELKSALATRHMVAAFSLEYLCFANSAEYDWSAQLLTYFFPKGFLATCRTMPRFSALKANRSLTLRTV
jgi:hypothetical protein